MKTNNRRHKSDAEQESQDSAELESEAQQEVQTQPPAVANSHAAAPQTESMEEAIARCLKEADVVERALPASFLRTIVFKNTGSLVSPAGFRTHLDQLFAAYGNPTDPVERMMLEEMVFAHFRIGDLHALAAGAESSDLNVAYTEAARKLTGENRKMALALRQYRSSVVPSQVVINNQQNVTAADGASTVGSPEKNRDIEQGHSDHVDTPTIPFVTPESRTARPGEETQTLHTRRAAAAE